MRFLQATPIPSQDEPILPRPRAADTVVMTIDGNEERWHAGIHPASTPTRIITADLTPP
jgi:hypothetical protein